MITKEYSKGLSEVLVILDNIEPEYVNKIPKNVRSFFAQNAAKDYIPNFDTKAEIKNMDLLNETKSILSVIYLNYWAKNKEEKDNFIKILKNNQKIVDERRREKYNPDKIFETNSNLYQNSISQEPVKQNESLVEYKESFFGSIISKIKDWLKSLFKK